MLGLQEASVIGMADGYAQATRNAGFVNLHSGAGVGNALGNIYTAHRNQTPLVITAGQQARSHPAAAGVPLRRARLGISAALCQIQRRAGAGRGRAGGDRARLLRGDAAALRADLRLGADRRLDSSDPAGRGAQVSRELGPDPAAMKALVAALAESKRPALVVGPGVDRAGAVDLMVASPRRPGRRSGSARFRRAAPFPERHPQFAGFLHASPGQLSDALHEHDLVVVIGAPVFTFHVEGHASIFDGATTIFQITDDPTAAAVTPSGTSIIATMKPALTMLLELLPQTKRAMPAAAACRRRRRPPTRSRSNS